LDKVSFDRLSIADNKWLIIPFCLMKIESVVRDIDGNKSSRPDGYNFSFVNEIWYLVKDEVIIMFDQFHANEVLSKGTLAYFLALIPKMLSPLALKDYQHISFLSNLYLVKVLSRRLAKVMNLIISTTQSTFIKGRNLVDGMLVVNELVDYTKKMNKQFFFIFKVDFEKSI